MKLASAPPPARVKFGRARLPSGIRLSYAEQGDPHGESLILLHGYSDSWFSFSRILPLLDPSWHALGIDFRGHGSSDRPAEGYGMGDLAADVLAFLDDRRVERATIVGHSMGSLVAQRLAVWAPERVVRLVLIGSVATPARSAGLHEIATAVRAFGNRVPEDFLRDFQSGCVYRPMPPEFMDRVIAESRKLPLHAWRGLIEGMLSAEPAAALGTSGIPALLLWGEHDAVFTRAEQEDLLRMIGTAELKVYPETGHTPHWERPGEVAGDLRAFVVRTGSR